MRVLVTGARGFLGEAIARRFADRPHVELWTLGRRAGPALGRAVLLDLGDRPALDRALGAASPDLVIHAAGRRRGGPAQLLADNALATSNLAEALGRVAPGAALIILGSAAQYGASETHAPWRESDICVPADPYAISKHVAEQSALAAARRLGFEATALRLFNVVAPRPHGDQALDVFLRRAAQAARGGPPPWRAQMRALGAVRDFVAVADVLEAVERTAARGVWGETINVCTGVGRPTRELIEAAAEAVGGIAIEEAEGEAEGLDWSVGDPARCEALLGFAPSADLTDVLRQAAEGITSGRDSSDARSRA